MTKTDTDLNGAGSKVYVSVIAQFDINGAMFPRILQWEDGRKYRIDRIKSVCPAPALKAGGQGDRYTVVINGKESYLFFEHSTDAMDSSPGRWFVERK